MTFKTHVTIANGRIDAAPMINVVLLLLVFLLLSSPFVLQSGFGLVEMPTARGPKNVSLQELVITISRDNLLFFKNQPTTLAKLPELLRSAAGETRNPELIIKADRQVGYDTLIQVIDSAFEAGIAAINLATRSEVPVLPSK